MEKPKHNKSTRQREREIFKKGLAKRIAEFMKLTGLEHAHRLSGKPSGYPGWIQSRKESEAFVHGNRFPELLKDLRGSYPKEQPCIGKLLLACFCLGVPARRMFALMAPLLTNRISTTNIVQVATNLDCELAGYHRSRPHKKLSGLLDSAKRRQTTRTIARNREVNPYPSTLPELEEELDRLLISLQSVEADLWNRLKTAGLVKGKLRRSAARQKKEAKGHSGRHTGA
jgi:hypothetical protein